MPNQPRTLPLTLVLLAVALAALGVLALTRGEPATPEHAPAGAAIDEPAPSPATAAVGGAAAMPTDQAMRTAPRAEAADASAAAAPAPAAVRVRVLDSRGAPLAGVPVAFVPFDPSERRVRAPDVDPAVVSDTRGELTLPAPGAARVLAAGRGWYTLRTTAWRPEGAATATATEATAEAAPAPELLVVVAPAVALTGRIVGPDGLGIAGATARTELFLLDAFPRQLPEALVPFDEPATADANGDYRLAAVPLAAGVDLLFGHPGHGDVRVPSPEAASGRLDVTLPAANGAVGTIRGRVRDDTGPVAGATLLLGADQQTTSDARGEFTFAAPERPSRLLATRAGWQPVLRENVGRDTPELDVVFVARALQIAGAVRRADGAPAAGWRVDVLDPVRGYGYRPIEAECSDVDPSLATTDADGRFRIGGLADRTYRLLAYEPATIHAIESPPIAAGTTDVVLTIAADAILDELRGTVVDRRGAAIAGATVHAYLKPPSEEGIVSGPSVTTGADGRFVLAKLPRRAAKLGASKEGWVFAMQPIETWLRDGAELRIELQRLCAFQVEGADGLAVAFLDGAGATLFAESHSQDMTMAVSALELRGGKSPVMVLPDSVATMTWSRGGKELGRKPVFLDPATGAITLLIAAP